MARTPAILCCVILALAMHADTVSAGKGGCTQQCTDVCKDVSYNECKDISVPYQVCTDIYVTKTKKECSKVCTGGKGYGYGKGRKLLGKGSGGCNDVCKDVPYTTTDKKCETKTKTAKKCETKTKKYCTKDCKPVCTTIVVSTSKKGM